MMELEEAGINLIIGVDEQWVGNGGMKAMLDRAEDHGISVIANLRGWDGETVPEYADHPALKGFLMFDEPSATDFETLAALKAKFDELMPEDLVFYINLFPQTCSYESLFGDNYSANAVDYEKNYVDVYLETVEPEQLGFDYYPLMENDRIKPTYFRNFDILTHKAQENELPMEATILSAGHNTTDGAYVTPTAEQLRWQIAVALAYGVDGVNHYVYTSHEEDYTTMVEFDTLETTELYDSVKTVNNEFVGWDDIYLSYNWLGTAKVDVDEENLMLKSLTYDIPLDQYGNIKSVDSDQDLLVGVFENADNQSAYMITNAGNSEAIKGIDYLADFSIEDATVTVQLDSGNYKCVAVIMDGIISYVAVDANNTFTLNLGANEGAFVIPMAK